MAMPEVRVLGTDAELLRAAEVFRTAMVGLPAHRPWEPGQIGTLFEPGRTLGAFVDGELVGTADSTSGGLVLPGGRRVPHAAVTHVGVLPTHTRRGVVTALLRHQLRDARDRGEVVASLRASEATIYERFGYAVASTSTTVELDVARARVRATVGHGDEVRLVDADRVWALLPRIAANVPPGRAGTIDRTPQWWAFQELRAAADEGPAYVAVHGKPGAETGFVRYHPIGTDTWFTSAERTVVVDDLFVPTTEAYLGLVRFLLSLDLVDKIVFAALAPDDPLPWLLTDHRAVRVLRSRDETWLRLLDVPTALSGRTYAGTGSVTVAVADAVLPENSGAYRISATGSAPVNGLAQLEVDVSALAPLILGGTRWHQLRCAGLVRVRDDAALPVAEQLFATPSAPFAGIYF